MQFRNKILLILSTVIFCFSFFLIHIIDTKPIITYTIVYLSSSIIFLLFAWQIFKYDFSTGYFIALLAIGILIRASFISTQPIGSDDIYRYMWDGKVQTNGINPYLYLPGDTSLQNLHSEIIPKLVNFPDMKTIYFPLSQWLFYTGYTLSGESVWGYKLLLLIFELITLSALFFLARKINIPNKYILLYALCPLPIMQFSIDAHLDCFGLPLLILALFFYMNDKKNLSLIFLGLSFSIKPVGLLLIPIIFFHEKKLLERFKIIIIPLIVFIVQFIPYIFTSNPFEAFFIYAKNWTFNGIIFSIIDSLLQNNQTSRIICGILLLISLLPFIFSKLELLHKFYYSIIILFIFSPVVHPWYIAWLAVLLPVIPRLSGIFYTSLSSLTVFTVLSYQIKGLWKEYPVVLLFEYVPVIFFMIYELRNENLFNQLKAFIKKPAV